MSFMARMRSGTGSLETPPTLSTTDGGISIFCSEKYWHRSAKRVLAFCQLLLLSRQGIQPLFVLVTVVNRSGLATRSELVERTGPSLRPVLLFFFRHLLGNSFLISSCRAKPLLDCGSSVVPPGVAGLTHSADGAKAWLRPGTGPTVAPEN